MKKLMTCVIFALLLGATLHANKPSPLNFGPGDALWWLNVKGVNIKSLSVNNFDSIPNYHATCELQ